jgi:glycine cleavage system H protein
MAEVLILDDRRYTQEHEWVKIEGGLAVMGLTAYAATQLGDITYVELPKVGDRLAQMGALGVVESVKAAADFYSPLAGVVAEINAALEGQPQLINQDCYGAGWLVKLHEYDAAGLANLLDHQAYQALVAGL